MGIARRAGTGGGAYLGEITVLRGEDGAARGRFVGDYAPRALLPGWERGFLLARGRYLREGVP